MRKNLASRAWAAIPLLLVASGSSCSLVYDLSADQCSSNADCVARFGQGYSCDVGICTCQGTNCQGTSSEAGSSGKGGKGGSGATTAGSSSADAGEAGADSGAGGTSDMSTAGTAGTAGTGGGAVAECEVHKDCFELYPDDSEENPRACVEGTCVPLKSPDCPIVLPVSDNPDPDDPSKPSWNALKSTNAIVLGAFSPALGTTLDTYGRNYDLPVTELADTTGGVKVGTSQPHQIVVVVCNMIYDTQDKLLAPARHLMEELKVPGVASTLYLQDQRYVWDNVARDNGVFMMMPLYSDQALIDEEDDSLIWHMLSGANALSVSYQPLLNMTVDHLRALGALGADEVVKVAHVKARDEPFLQDTAAYLEENLQLNGKPITENGSSYKPIQVTSTYKAPADKQEAAIESVLASAPHIVIGTTVSEIIKFIIPGVEKDWDTRNPGRARPFYLLGALDYNDPGMGVLINGDTSITNGQKPLYQRILGMNWPAAADQRIYNAYQQRWEAVYGAPQGGYENFYDAMYYLLYGVAAARIPIKYGSQIAAGLLRVTQHGSKIPQVAVGPSDDMVKALTELSRDSSSKYELIGAMGPPSWDPNGARTDAASVWCVNPVGTYQPDQLRYDASDSSLQPSDATLIDSDIKCFTFPEAPTE
jgi:hypothetical protein